MVLVWTPEGEVRDATPSPGSGFYALPSVHPRGSSVIYHGGTDGPSRIWRTNLEDGAVTALTPESLVACSPSFSPDGRRIVFSAYEAAEYPPDTMTGAVHRFPGVGIYFGGVPYWMSIYTMNADGSGIERITEGTSSDARPAFHANGREVLFLRRRRPPWGRRGLWSIVAEPDQEPRPLVTDTSIGRPASSVDGSSIYFFTRVAGRNRIARMPASGGAWEGLANDTLGAWSHGPFCDPDGEHLWYHCGVEGGSLCRLPLDGGDPVVMRPPGFEQRSCAHASVSETGVVAFDWLEYA